MNVFRTFLFAILMLFIVSAQCNYVNNFEIKEVSVSTLYPLKGENVTINVMLEGMEFSTNEIRIFYDEGYTKRFITSEQIYISKGNNVYELTFKLPPTAHSIGVIEVNVGNIIETIPVIYNESYDPKITEMENDENYTLSVLSEKPINFKIKSNQNEKNVEIKSNGSIVDLNIKRCENCELFIEFEYDNEVVIVYKRFGEYVKPYIYVNKIENKNIEFTSCPEQYIASITYNTGYETYTIENVKIDLNKFNSEEKNEIKIIQNNPLTLLITANDGLNREIKSKGDLFVECDGNNYFMDIEFVKEKEITYILDKNITCNFTYGNAKVNAKVYTYVEEEKIEDKKEVIYWEDYITYTLILLVVLVMGIILYKWNGMSKK